MMSVPSIQDASWFTPLDHARGDDPATSTVDTTGSLHGCRQE